MRKYIIIIIFNFSFTQVTSDYIFSGTHTSALAGANTSSKIVQKSFQHNPAILAEIDHQFIRLDYINMYNLSFLKNKQLNSLIELPILGNIGLHIEQFSVEYMKQKYGKGVAQIITISQYILLAKTRMSSIIVICES